MIKAVFFDFYGTLVGWEPAASEIQRVSAAAEGLELDAIAIGRAYPTANALLDRENSILPLTYRTPEQRDAFFVRYEHALLAKAGYDVSFEMAESIWLRVRKVPKELALYSDARTTLEELRTDGFSLGVISNMSENLPCHLEYLGVLEFFGATVSSGDVGVAKPDSRMFQTALAKIGIEASDALHVGDGYESDVLGAASAGLRAVYLQRNVRAADSGEHTVISSLSDIPAYVRGINNKH